MDGGARKTKKSKRSSWWRTVLASLFVAIAAVSLVGAAVTGYVQRNVLDTNGYLAIIGPLPEDPRVAAALANFTTTKIFDTTNTEASIKEFLPPKLGALAGPLSETLEKRVNQRTKEFVQSDNFNAIWTTANRITQKGILRLAESKAGEGKLAAVGSLDLSRLASTVRERYGEGSVPTNQQQAKATTIKVDLKQRVERLRTTVRAIKAGAYVLPYLAIAFLLAAVAVAYNRRRAIIAIGVTVLLLGVAMLLAFKIASGSALGEITDPVYKSAAEVVYEAFYGDLRGRIILAMVFGGVLVVLALLAGPYSWARWLRTKFALPKLRNLEPYRWALNIRRLAAKYEIWLGLAGAAATIIWLLALTTLTTATLVVILSLLIAYASLVHLVARPTPAARAS